MCQPECPTPKLSTSSDWQSIWSIGSASTNRPRAKVKVEEKGYVTYTPSRQASKPVVVVVLTPPSPGFLFKDKLLMDEGTKEQKARMKLTFFLWVGTIRATETSVQCCRVRFQEKRVDESDNRSYAEQL